MTLRAVLENVQTMGFGGVSWNIIDFITIGDTKLGNEMRGLFAVQGKGNEMIIGPSVYQWKLKWPFRHATPLHN